MSSLFKTKDIDSLVEDTQAEGTRLKRTLGHWHGGGWSTEYESVAAQRAAA
jgi:hypothetical protein